MSEPMRPPATAYRRLVARPFPTVWTGLVLTAALASCLPSHREPATANSGEPPLLLDDPPLVLEGQPGGVGGGGAFGPLANNSRCHVCHLNYETEELAVAHARADLGCEACHGASDAHCSDEDNITPPDILFPEARIEPFCTECHDSLGEGHERERARAAPGKPLCTDCHGDHRLSHRTRRWDRVTGELIEDDSVRMIDR